jgi:FkbH-like protein
MMADSKVRALIVSDFNAQNLAGYLNNSHESPTVRAEVAPFGQVMQALTDFSMPCWEDTPEVVVVWTRPQAVLATVRGLLQNARPKVQDLLPEVDAFTRAVRGVCQRARLVLVPTWTLPPYERGLGMIDLKSEHGLSYQLMRANLRLAENLTDVQNAFVLDAERWISQAGSRHAHNPKLWYMGKIGFGNDVFKQAVDVILAAIRGAGGAARKLVVLDLDDTLWGGTVGDTGWEGIRLGGHDPIGEALVDFQAALKGLKNRGVLLGIVSKNDENLALEAIRLHPEMVLRLDDFSGWRINWEDKAANLRSLVAELNLGLQSTVFIDDNPLERSRVKAALPDVMVPEWPDDKLLYRQALQSLTCFDAPVITEEDLDRTRLYSAERERAAARDEAQSFDDWLRSLETRVFVEPLSAANLPRTAQLLNKTNQMNLATRRLTEKELLAWSEAASHRVWAFRVQDKFGDSGLTGIASIQLDGDVGIIVDFVLSCRVMGRKVEEAMLSFLGRAAGKIGARHLSATYSPTPRNKVCLAFWQERSGFEAEAEGRTFHRDLAKPLPAPEGILLVSPEP